MLRQANIIPIMTKDSYGLFAGEPHKSYCEFIKNYSLDELLKNKYMGSRVYTILKQAKLEKASPEQVFAALIKSTASLTSVNQIKGDGSDWSRSELSILCRTTKVMPEVNVGAKTASLIFVSDLKSWPDEIQLTGIGRDASFTQRKLDQFLEQTILPSLLYAASSNHSEGVVFTLPVLSSMSDGFKRQVNDYYLEAIRKLLAKYYKYFDKVKAVVITGIEKSEKNINDLRLITTKEDLTGLYPEKFISGIEHCELFTCVATNPISLPGNDASADEPGTNEGLICQTTNVSSLIAGKDKKPELNFTGIKVLEENMSWNDIPFEVEEDQEIEEDLEVEETFDDVAHYADDILLEPRPGLLKSFVKNTRQFFIDHPWVKHLLVGAVIGAVIVGIVLIGAASWGAAYGIGAGLVITIAATFAGGLTTGGAVGVSLGFVAFVSVAHTIANYFSAKCCVPGPLPLKVEEKDVNVQNEPEQQQKEIVKTLRKRNPEKHNSPYSQVSQTDSGKVVPFPAKNPGLAKHGLVPIRAEPGILVTITKVQDHANTAKQDSGSASKRLSS